MSFYGKNVFSQPTVPPPPGVTRNLGPNQESLHPYGVLTHSLCLTITTLLVWIRIWTKKFVLNGLGWEDCSVVIAWLGLVAYETILLVNDNYGYGRHLWNVTLGDYIMFAKLIFADQILYSVVIFFAKLSIMLLYIRIFNLVRPTYILLWILIWVNLLKYTAGIFVEVFQCHPKEKQFFIQIPGKCANQKAIQVSSALFNTISDFAIIILPIMSVWRLQMRSARKAGIILIFATGLFGCVTSIIRLTVLATQNLNKDGTWVDYAPGLWSTAEIACAIIVSCLPPLPAFFRYVRGKTITQSKTSAPSNEKPSRQETPKTMRKDNTWDEISQLERCSTNTTSV